VTADYYKNDISLNDARALLLGHGLWLFRRERVDLLEEYERDLADCSEALDDAKSSGNEEAIEKCSLAAQEASLEFERAGDLYTKLCGEIAKIRKDKPSDIVMVEDDPEGKGYDLVLISRQSLYDWAKSAKIDIGSAHPPPTRTHTTPLLDLLDELIREFWEGYDGGTQPKNEVIYTSIKKKYGDYTKDECSIPGATENTIKTMCTIMRHPDMRNVR
jgi:hypothetical protein